MFSIGAIGCGVAVPVQGLLSGLSLILELFALVLRKLKGWQWQAFSQVPLKKFLILHLVLVGQAELARNLRVPKYLLLHWGVVLSPRALVVGEALGLLVLDREGLVGWQSLILAQLVSCCVVNNARYA